MSIREAAKLDKYIGLREEIRELGKRLRGPICLLDFGDLHKLEEEEECKEIEEKYLNEKFNNIRFEKLLNMKFDKEGV